MRKNNTTGFYDLFLLFTTEVRAACAGAPTSADNCYSCGCFRANHFRMRLTIITAMQSYKHVTLLLLLTGYIRVIRHHNEL